MKSILYAFCLVATAVAVSAEEPSVGQAPQASPATAPVETAGTPASPAATELPPEPAIRIPGLPARATDSADSIGTNVNSAVISAGSGWSGDGVELREHGSLSSGTNRVTGSRGILPRAARPERRGAGGFLAGFANLFNPFAPTSQGVETANVHWYDAQLNTAPLPRGFRDERTHEAQTSVFQTGFEPSPRQGKRAAPPEPQP